MGKFCSNCGHPVNPGNAFCTFCGARLQPSAAPQPPQPPQQMMQDLQAARQILLSQPLPDYRRASACLQDAARYGQTAELQKLQQLVQFYQQADMLRQQELPLMPRNAQVQGMYQAPGGQGVYQAHGMPGQPGQPGQMAQGRQGATGPLQTIPVHSSAAANGGHPSPQGQYQQHQQNQQQSGGPSALKTAAAGFAGAAAGTMLANALHNSSGSPGAAIQTAVRTRIRMKVPIRRIIAASARRKRAIRTKVPMIAQTIAAAGLVVTIAPMMIVRMTAAVGLAAMIVRTMTAAGSAVTTMMAVFSDHAPMQ